MDLNTILIILGVIALVGLVGHGVWSNRREKSQYFEQSRAFEQNRPVEYTSESALQPQQEQIQADQIQQAYQIQQESAVKSKVEFQSNITKEPPFSDVPQPLQQSVGSEANFAATVENIRITIPQETPSSIDSVASEQHQSVIYEYRPEPKQPAANLSERTLSELAEFADTEQGIHSPKEAEEIRISLQNAVASPISQAKPIEPEPLESAEQSKQSEISDYLMLYVVAPEKYQFQGNALAQALDELGFILGRDGLYHRHLDLTVASPVLFSIANVEQPGTFNSYQMQHFATDGVVMFMQLPSIGNARTNLKMMLRAAKNLAERLEGFVLTDNEQILDENAEANYLERL